MSLIDDMMRIIDLSQANSVLHRFVAELRDKTIQQDSMRFRRNLERIGEVMAYEISKTFEYAPADVVTPLVIAPMMLSSRQIVVSTILRAGLPFHQGFLSYLDHAENAFVSAYRKYKDRINFDIHVEYISSPSLDDKLLIVTDPMLATGASMELAYKALLTKGLPNTVHFASIVASKQALLYLEKMLGETDITVWVAAIDADLDEHSYIVPGLGDAGDLAFGVKI